MLLSVIGMYDKDKSKRILQDIKEAYWPYQYITSNDGEIINKLPQWNTPQSSDKVIKETKDEVEKIIDGIVNNNQFYSGYGDEFKISKFELPFEINLFKYFIQRKYDIPYRDPQDHFDDIFRLEREDKYEQNRHKLACQEYNYSRNYGDFNHFLNVVIATARLIEYFTNTEHFSIISSRNEAPKYSEILVYKPREQWSKEDSKRCFLLMLSAFYHDIGKTIVYPRHAMEGSTILTNHTTRPVYLFNKISTSIYGFDFNLEDFMLVSHLVCYHDQYGTLATGEAGYLRLVELLHPIKRYAYRTELNRSVEDQMKLEKERILKCIFDLWILNIADMMVSIPSDKFGKKFEFQNSLFDKDETEKRIEDLLKSQCSRTHDLYLTLSLVDQLCKNRHSDDLSGIESAALDYARRHAAERIFRLLRAILIDYIPHYKEKFKPDCIAIQLLDEIKDITESDWHAIICRSINSVSDFKEFIRRFAWVGQMDYSFSFFQKIAEGALQHVNREEEDYLQLENKLEVDTWKKIHHSVFRSSWSYRSAYTDYPKNFLIPTDAKFFAENFSSILVQILHHLLFREKEFDRLINFEFSDAAERLTDEKIDRIISLEGPHRARRTIHLALEGIYFFK